MKSIFLFLLLLLTIKASEFNLDYIGDSLSNEEADARDFCTRKYCVNDTEILFKATTRNASVDPCKDFKEFSMGSFIKDQELPERYFSIGLLPKTQRLHEERLRKLLESDVDEKNDPRVFKVIKNFFGKCVSSTNNIENDRKEIINYLQSLGGSPILNGDSWDPSQFNLSKIIEHEPFYGVLSLLDYEFKPWSNLDGWNRTPAIPSFIKEGVFSWEDDKRLTFKHYKEMLIEMFNLQTHNSTYRQKLEANIDKAIDRLKTFGEELIKHKGTSEESVLQLKDLSNYTPNLKLNWFQIINEQLLKSVSLTEEDKILLYSPTTLKSLSLELESIDKGILADVFVFKFLYANRFLFILYPFDWKDKEYTSNSEALPRWEQCLNYVKENMRPALEVLLSIESYRDAEKLDKFAKDAIQDFIEKVKTENETILSKEVKEKTVEKLNKIKVLSKLFTKDLNDKNLDEYYDELDLKGDETFIQSALKMQKFLKKIRNDYKDHFTEGSKSWLESAAQVDLVTYNTLSDELNIPSVWTFYPWYHADRPKFFNQATLYLDIITAVKFNIVRYINNVLHFDAQKLHNAIDEFKFAYDNYVEWEKSGGKDLLLKGNRLTNKQLFWLALARSRYRKQKGVPGIEGNDYERTFFWFKHKDEPLETYDSFKDAYHCSSNGK